MRSSRFLIKLAVVLGLAIFSGYLANRVSGVSKPKENKLYRVRKIYLDKFGTVKDRREISIYKQALENAGFVVVDDRSEAEGILTRYPYHALNGDSPSETMKFLEPFALTLPNKERIWETSIRWSSLVLDRGIDHEDVERAIAETLAKRLSDDWKKSAKKAGVIK